MSVLSEKELIKQLGKGILFHPLKDGSIRSCNLCLTASEYAYSITEEKPLLVRPDEENQSNKFFLIQSKHTVLVWTDEAIRFSNNFCGSIHSTVSLVSKGLGHIGTRINPNWSGVLCITLHNLSHKDVKINIRDTKNPIAYIMTHRLVSNLLIESNIDVGARLDILEGLKNTEKIKDFYHNRENRWMMGNTEDLKEKMKSEDNKIYINLKDNICKQIERYLFSDSKNILALFLALISFFAGNFINSKNTTLKSIGIVILIFLGVIFVSIVILFIINFSSTMKNNSKNTTKNNEKKNG